MYGVFIRRLFCIFDDGRRTDDGPTTDEKTSDEKNSDEIIRTKKFGRKKNWGQGTGARHGRCGGKARVTEIPEGGKTPPDPPTTPFQKICPSGANFLK